MLGCSKSIVQRCRPVDLMIDGVASGPDDRWSR